MEKNEPNNMDIFDKGYVKPKIGEETSNIENNEKIQQQEEVPDEKEIEELIKHNENNQKYLYDELNEEEIETTEEEIDNLIKNNNFQNALNAKKLVRELEEAENIREEKEEKIKKKKNLIFLIGIIIEIVIIGFLIYSRYLDKNVSKEYSNQLTCTNTLENNNQKYSTTINNVYYFDSNNNVSKTVYSIIYIFNNKNDYNDYKNKFIENKKEFLGYKEENIFDDINYVYENRITYVYSKLKNNKKVSFENNTFTFKLPNETKDTTIYIDNYDNIVEQNKNVGIVCE